MPDAAKVWYQYLVPIPVKIINGAVILLDPISMDPADLIWLKLDIVNVTGMDHFAYLYIKQIFTWPRHRNTYFQQINAEDIGQIISLYHGMFTVWGIVCVTLCLLQIGGCCSTGTFYSYASTNIRAWLSNQTLDLYGI